MAVDEKCLLLVPRATVTTVTNTREVSLPDGGEQTALWDYLARQRKVRLPRADARLSSGGMTRWLRTQLHISVTQWQNLSQEKIREFARENPHFTLKAWAGCALEQLAVIEADKSLNEILGWRAMAKVVFP